ncbi:hypothetical protein A7U60_g2656 [Sanghuangporus baumii]|uniref:Uncharacterized protein n=1 Tax=Sanghuangporus baumii TaxID=108892 RepID=A0A9Q5I1T2_SANBA|nr:hypothetical protein A7U60_g2656 [Sanghuangporus baumii]
MTRQLGRANTPPSGDVLNALDLALKEAVLSSVSALNGTASTVLDSAVSPSASASATLSATGSEAVSASASASAISAIGSSVPESAGSATSSASAIPQSVVASATPSASSAPSQEVSSAAPTPTSSIASAAPRSASSSDLALSVPKNAAAVSSSSTEPAATPAPSAPASSTEKSAASLKTNAQSSPAASPASAASTESPKTNTTSSSEAAVSTTTTAVPAPSSSSISSAVKLETTSSAAPVTSVSTQVQLSPSPQVLSSSSNVASTQRAETSRTAAATSSNRNEQASSPNNSPQSTNAASPPQATGTSNQTQNLPSNANLRGSQPSAANSPSPQTATSLGNTLLGASPSSTVHVDSTLSTPQGVTISSGGSTFVTTPAVFTSISVSSGKDGTPLATFTSVFANPTTVPQTASLSDSSFWDKKGVVAGVFTAVGLIMLASILGIIYLCRRQRRETGRPFAKPARFHRFSDPPEMSQQPTTYQPVRPRRFPIDDPQRYLLAPSITSGHSNGHEDPAMMRSASRTSSDAHQPGALGLTGVLANSSGEMQDYHGPFSDYHRYISTGDTRLSTPPGETVGMAATTDFSPKESKPEREAESGPAAAAERRSAPSPAPSSPSIYPPSLPAVPETDEDDYLFYERETKRGRPESQLPSPPPRAVVNDAPDPRNPFSSPLDPVYESAHKQTVSPQPPRIVTNQAYRPLTPPDSSAGHSPSTPQSPEPGESTKPLNVAPYSNTFLGRSVSMRTEFLPRPKRSPLRLSASGASLHQNSELP